MSEEGPADAEQPDAEQPDVERWEGPLPEPVRARVVALAATTLAGLSPPEVPSRLAAVARFRADRLARLAAVELALAVADDAAFRRRVCARLREQHPGLVEAIGVQGGDEAVDPVEVAAG